MEASSGKVVRLVDEGLLPRRLAPAVHELARAVEAFSEYPGSPHARRSARASAVDAAQWAASRQDGGTDRRVALVAKDIRLVASDVQRVAASAGGETEPPASETATSAERR